VVAVMGGDGTAIQAASGLVGSGVALGLVPGGTGNLLAGNLRVPTTPLAATELILRGRTRAVDLGRLDRDDGVHYFGVACGDGAAADVMSETPTQAKRRWGIGGYFTTLFTQNFDPTRLLGLIAVLAAMAIALNEVVRRAEVHFGRWHTD